MLYKHCFNFYVSEDNIRNICSSFIHDDKLDCSTLLPTLANLDNPHRKVALGTIESYLPATFTHSGFEIVCEDECLLPIAKLIAEQNKGSDFEYKSAGSDLKSSLVSFNLACGRVMRQKKIPNPAMFACSLWGCDYADYISKLENNEVANVETVAKVKPFYDGDETDFTDIDSILDEGDD